MSRSNALVVTRRLRAGVLPLLLHALALLPWMYVARIADQDLRDAAVTAAAPLPGPATAASR